MLPNSPGLDDLGNQLEATMEEMGWIKVLFSKVGGTNSNFEKSNTFPQNVLEGCRVVESAASMR